MAVSTTISSNTALNSYSLFNATNIKSFIINQLKSGNNPIFNNVDYLGSNINAFIDIIAVMLQQINFNMSVNASETSFSNAVLYESMNKIVSLLSYKPFGKQTTMLPIRYLIDISKMSSDQRETKEEIFIPRLSMINYNTPFVQKQEISVSLDKNVTTYNVDSVMFEGNINEISPYYAVGDEFEVYTLVDKNINTNNKFISDNFFLVYVDLYNNGQWEEYTETANIFLENSTARKYEKRFNDLYNYEFKFGNGINGVKLRKNSRVAIFYIVSNGERAILSDGIISKASLTRYTSPLYDEIMTSLYNLSTSDMGDLQYITVSNIGQSTSISYPESVESIRTNAPKIFSSQSRLITLSDYKAFIDKNFSTYCKDTFFSKNDFYTNDYLNYFYELGLDSPQKDSRINIAQVEFMSSTNFNNVYCYTLPAVNTIIDNKVPNYLNTVLKQEIVNAVEPYKLFNHNLVILDPIYKACTFGSYNLTSIHYNENQLKNKLIIKRDRLSKYNYTWIKDYIVSIFMNYFDNMLLGSILNINYLSRAILNVPGVKSFLIRDVNGNEDSNLTFYVWNPLYSNEDNYITQQNIINKSFIYTYFYDLNNISNLIQVEDE